MSNLNEVRQKAVSVMLDKPRTLRYDLNAFAELEEMYGSMDGLFNVVGKENVSFKDLKNLVWAGLLHELEDNEELSVKQVGKMIDMTNINEVAMAMQAAFEGSVPKADKKAKNA